MTRADLYAFLAGITFASLTILAIVLFAIKAQPSEAPACQDRAIYIGAWNPHQDCPEGTTLRIESNVVTCRCPVQESP